MKRVVTGNLGSPRLVSARLGSSRLVSVCLRSAGPSSLCAVAATVTRNRRWFHRQLNVKWCVHRPMPDKPITAGSCQITGPVALLHYSFINRFIYLFSLEGRALASGSLPFTTRYHRCYSRIPVGKCWVYALGRRWQRRRRHRRSRRSIPLNSQKQGDKTNINIKDKRKKKKKKKKKKDKKRLMVMMMMM